MTGAPTLAIRDATKRFGAVMIGVIRNGMNLLNVDAFLQPIVIGVVIVVAVESDVVRSRLEDRFRVLQAARA
jgi:ribose transport system permease protein